MQVADRVFIEASQGASEMVERIRLADEKKRKRIRSQAHILQYGPVRNGPLPLACTNDRLWFGRPLQPRYYQLNAQQGSTESQVVMGQLYYQGAHGYEQDFDRAAGYFQDAAGQVRRPRAACAIRFPLGTSRSADATIPSPLFAHIHARIRRVIRQP